MSNKQTPPQKLPSGDRQGDVWLRNLSTLPLTPPDSVSEAHEFTLAYGEVTGHHHTLYPETPETPDTPPLKILRYGERVFLDVPLGYWLRHQEHHEVRITPGIREITIEKNYNPFKKVFEKAKD